MYKIIKYEERFADIWDDFVMNKSINGTFLQTRRFLNYHPKDRFTDSSFIIFDGKEQIAAVCPGCDVYENENKVFFSHKGSTYGGIVLGSKCNSVNRVSAIIDEAEKYICNNGYSKIVYKMTPELFAKENSSLLEYVLYSRNYSEEKELNLQIEFETYKDNILSNFSQGKRTNVNNCLKEAFQLRELTSESEIWDFYEILKITLDKYSLKPIHTPEELCEFNFQRLKEETAFWGIYHNDRMIAGSMMFLFNNIKIAHAQYLAALPEYNKISISTYLYYCMIIEMKKLGMKKLSWGIVSEHGLKQINEGLANSKEAYGSKYSINRIFVKTLGFDF